MSRDARYFPYPVIVFLLAAELLTIPYSFFDLLVFTVCFFLPGLDDWFQTKWRQTKTAENHHHWIGHWPVTYLPLLVILPLHPGIAAFLALYGIASHLLIDSFITPAGIQWFYPWFPKNYHFRTGLLPRFSLTHANIAVTVLIVLILILHFFRLLWHPF